MPNAMPPDLNIYDVYLWTLPRKGDGYAVLIGTVEAINVSAAWALTTVNWPQYREQTQRYANGRLILRQHGNTDGIPNIRS